MLGFLTRKGAQEGTDADANIVARLEFVQACFDMARLNPRVAAIAAGQSEPSLDTVRSVLDQTIPVLSSVADRLEAEAARFAAWNVSAAGRNEIITQDARRNWLALESLAESSGNAGNA